MGGQWAQGVEGKALVSAMKADLNLDKTDATDDEDQATRRNLNLRV